MTSVGNLTVATMQVSLHAFGGTIAAASSNPTSTRNDDDAPVATAAAATLAARVVERIAWLVYQDAVVNAAVGAMAPCPARELKAAAVDAIAGMGNRGGRLASAALHAVASAYASRDPDAALVHLARSATDVPPSDWSDADLDRAVRGAVSASVKAVAESVSRLSDTRTQLEVALKACVEGMGRALDSPAACLVAAGALASGFNVGRASPLGESRSRVVLGVVTAQLHAASGHEATNALAGAMYASIAALDAFHERVRNSAATRVRTSALNVPLGSGEGFWSALVGQSDVALRRLVPSTRALHSVVARLAPMRLPSVGDGVPTSAVVSACAWRAREARAKAMPAVQAVLWVCSEAAADVARAVGAQPQGVEATRPAVVPLRHRAPQLRVRTSIMSQSETEPSTPATSSVRSAPQHAVPSSSRPQQHQALNRLFGDWTTSSESSEGEGGFEPESPTLRALTRVEESLARFGEMRTLHPSDVEAFALEGVDVAPLPAPVFVGGDDDVEDEDDDEEEEDEEEEEDDE